MAAPSFRSESGPPSRRRTGSTSTMAANGGNPYHVPSKSSPLSGAQPSDDVGRRLAPTPLRVRKEGERRTARRSSEGYLREMQQRQASGSGPSGEEAGKGKGKERAGPLDEGDELEGPTQGLKPPSRSVSAHHAEPRRSQSPPSQSATPQPSPSKRVRLDNPTPEKRASWFGAWSSGSEPPHGSEPSNGPDYVGAESGNLKPPDPDASANSRVAPTGPTSEPPDTGLAPLQRRDPGPLSSADASRRGSWFGWGSTNAPTAPSPAPLASASSKSAESTAPIPIPSTGPASVMPPTSQSPPMSSSAPATSPSPIPVPQDSAARDEVPPRTWFETLTLRPTKSLAKLPSSSATATEAPSMPPAGTSRQAETACPSPSTQASDAAVTKAHQETAPSAPGLPEQEKQVQRKASWWGWGRAADELASAPPEIPEGTRSSDQAVATSTAEEPSVTPSSAPIDMPQQLATNDQSHSIVKSGSGGGPGWGSWMTGWYGRQPPYRPGVAGAEGSSSRGSPSTSLAPDSPRVSATVPSSPALRAARPGRGDVYALPNPVLQTLPSTSKGWSSYFSSRANQPQRLITASTNADKDDLDGVESMEVDLPPAETTQIAGHVEPGKSVPPSPVKGRKEQVTAAEGNPIAGLKAPGLAASTSGGVPASAVPPTSPRPASIAAIPAARSSSTKRGESSARPVKDGQPAPGQQEPEPEHSRPATPLTGPVDPKKAGGKGAKTPKPLQPNLVLPTFEDTFSRPPRSFPPPQSALQKTLSVVQSYFFSQPPPTLPTLTHEGAVKSKGAVQTEKQKKKRLREIAGKAKMDAAARLPKSLETMGVGPIERRNQRLAGLRRIVIVSLRGWAPAPWIRSFFGAPTASAKFAEMMAESVSSYISAEVGALNPDAIVCIPLEGEGRVEDRIELLYRQIHKRPEWTQALKEADAIFVASHSQGSVVSAQLFARMLEKGEVRGEVLTLLCMCGVWNGPFTGLSQSYALSPYFNYVEGPAARELFEFQDPKSTASEKLLRSLRILLDAGSKVLMVASLNDQVVPLYSALFTAVSHPSLLRAIFIDAAAFRSSDFLANLVVFCQRLRNAGISDHGLPSHLSAALAGSLTGVGHSLIYEEKVVFDLATRYFFETTSPKSAPTIDSPLAGAPVLEIEPYDPREAQNPYFLPWALRGILEDRHVRELFGNELEELRKQYDEWRPVTKALKDVRFKLEPLTLASHFTNVAPPQQRKAHL